ncbi:TRML4 protein, partial [Alaudala cheleensis]|nr:TRML4 protein [Alaudala cheleensis]
LQGQAPEVQRLREGDTLYLECPYPAESEYQDTKYWRRQINGADQEIVYTYSGSSKQSRDGRTKIKDDTTRRTVSVTMTDLKAEDSGTYFCAVYKSYNIYQELRTVSLNVFKADTQTPVRVWAVQTTPPWSLPSLSCSSSESPFLVLSVVLLLLLLLALLTSVALGVRHYQLLARAGTWGWAGAPSPPGSPGSRQSSQDGSKGSAYINLEVQPQPSPEDPVYCNVEPSQDPRNPPRVEYAVIAFGQNPRNGRE